MNQYYSAELSQKVLRGLKESYLKGNFTGGAQLYGYDIIDKKNVINPNEAEIVKEIFSKFANGHTGKAIADNLIQRGIRTKTGHYIDDKKIYKMISNTKYIGRVKHGDTIYTNIYPAIIDEITWQTVQNIRNANKHTPGSKKPKFGFLLSGKLLCGNCHEFMVGESGKSKSNDIYKYYTCLSRRRRKMKCDAKAVQKDWLEDLVIQTTWNLIKENDALNDLVNAIYKKHQTENKEAVLINSLEKRRNEALKTSNNLIYAIEQGIITEQTKTRLKELEQKILQFDFDIEQAKQRNYSNLTPDKILAYFNKVICGDINNDNTRSHIIKYFVREIILYNDYLVITYNITDSHTKKKTTPDDIEEIEKEIKQLQKAENNNNLCLYKRDCSLPKRRHIRRYVFCYKKSSGYRNCDARTSLAIPSLRSLQIPHSLAQENYSITSYYVNLI